MDRATASRVLPYAELSSNAYGASGASAVGYRRAGEWDAFAARAGKSQAEINDVAKSGFSATVFTKAKTPTSPQEVVIAYRGTEGLTAVKDWATNVGTAFLSPGGSFVPKQYITALELEAQVRRIYPNAKITVTGHSLGGGLASYVGSKTGHPTVTFNAARNPYSASGSNPGQINIVVPGDIVGDNLTSSPVGAGSLPGQTYTVRGVPNQGSIGGAHDIYGIIGALADVVRSP